jgi:DNA-binding response OmpR family regulator
VVDSQQLTILIVDDEEMIRKLVEAYFCKYGHRVVCAVDGQDGLDRWPQAEPDVVLLDVTLPGMEGWDVCRLIRETSSVPVIMLTARAQASDRQKGLDAGADAYLTKPFSLKALDATIRELVARPPATSAPD